MTAPARWLLLLLLSGIACFAMAAQPVESISVEDLTWTELRDQVRAGKTTIIIPIGGTEQSGPQIALGKHNARVKLLADAIARALGNALVAPVIAYVPEGDADPPTGHMRFPGTITISERAFESVLESAALGLRAHGFRDIVLIGDHGGYQRNMQSVANRLNRSWGRSPVRVHAVTDYYRLADSAFRDALRKRGFRDDEIGTHAGLADTSLTLALAPALVRSDVMRTMTPSTADGVHGDPRRSSAELGRVGVDAIVAGTVDAIRKAVAAR